MAAQPGGGTPAFLGRAEPEAGQRGVPLRQGLPYREAVAEVPDRGRLGWAGAGADPRSASSRPAALASVSAASEARWESRTSVAPTGSRSLPEAAMSAVRIRMAESSARSPAQSRPIRAATPA